MSKGDWVVFCFMMHLASCFVPDGYDPELARG